jgi:tetratricopeptide (TPR) repeat protein
MWFGRDKREQRRRRRDLAVAIDHGRQLRREDRDHETLQFFEEAMEQFPDSGEIRLLYGTALLLSSPRQGLSEIAKATEIDPTDPTLLTRAAHIMYSMKQLDHVRSYAKRAKELAPEDEFIFAPELLNLESNFAALDGEDDRAEECLRLAVKREPKIESLAVDLAKFLADRDRCEEALSVVDEAMKRTKGTMYLRRLRAGIVDGSSSESAPCRERRRGIHS